MSVVMAISRALSLLERTLVVVLLATMVLLAFLQVILRNFFSAGILWAEPFLRHLVLWIGFLGASLATQQEKHINIDILTRFAPPRVVNIIHIVTNLFAGIICATLANAGWTFLLSEKESGGVLFTVGSTGLPEWWFQIVIPVGFGLMSLRFLIRTIEHIVESFHPTSHTTVSTNVPTLDR